MAKVYIANGVDVDPQWTKSIVVSPDQRNWVPIIKTSIASITGVRVEEVLPGTPRDFKTRINIHDNGGRLVLTIDAQSVSSGSGTGEHTGWQDGTDAQMQVALSEIQSWL